ncbi:Guanine nucleotide exchange factor MSS4 [Folsomia candida]|uniref:Guanine nucleotide exchange factor MSS4 n=1 Tax=Folsomia candida TaxID=158441 RepID=A0A226EVZ3_FOLCA|nr:Guanine nucleotide exchange factor MSS4 [Folsomia candida]
MKESDVKNVPGGGAEVTGGHESLPAPAAVDEDKDGANFPESTAEPAEISDSVLDGKNMWALNCIFCPSKIMPAKVASYHVEERALPKMKQKKALSEGLEVEPLSRWFMVSDVMMFDNIGVSNAVGDIKYLTCADCEMGPVGWTDLSNKKCYIALARVRET